MLLPHHGTDDSNDPHRQPPSPDDPRRTARARYHTPAAEIPSHLLEEHAAVDDLGQHAPLLPAWTLKLASPRLVAVIEENVPDEPMYIGATRIPVVSMVDLNLAMDYYDIQTRAEEESLLATYKRAGYTIFALHDRPRGYLDEPL